ncbi:hypothetical protein [Bacillus cereus group sp. IBL03679]|uniref:hypothetical protein n=1 Tax=Bacillus cereus group sp. IBL03679 TaxID=3240095 RepID=UPI003D2F6749
MNQNVTKAREAVHALFSNSTTLQLKVTDYQVDQVAKLVECLSDWIHPKEKMCLLDQVKLAKRLSRERNLLNYGDFESSDWAGVDGWHISPHVYTVADNPIFKGHYLNLPSANNPILSDKIFPAYVYQKIEEAKLKPYTRYMVRGFVGSSKDLEILVARYDKEVHKRMNVPSDIISTNPCTGEPVSQPTPYPVMPSNTMPQDMWCNPCENGYQTAAGMMVQSTGMMCQNPHEFKFYIDIGELDMERNLGIWVGFKIGTTDGMATLDNIEVVEAGPLTGNALTRMQKREPKWKKKWAEKRMKIERAVQTARNAIQTLFTDSNQNRLQSAITLQNILRAEKLIQKIPYVYNQFLQGVLSAVPGEAYAYNIFQQFSETVAMARGLYNQRNVLVNGEFTEGLWNWNASDGTAVQQIGNASVLVISDWSANLSQYVCVKPEHSYLLRVTARKEGSGEGYVTISDGTEENTETLKFTVGEEETGATRSNVRSNMRERYHKRNMATPEAYGTSGYASNQNMMNYPPENYETNAYPGNNMNYPSESFGMNPYGDENSMMNYPSENYGENAYSGNNTMNDLSNDYEMNGYPGNTNMSMNQGSDCGCGCSKHAYSSEHMMNNYPPNQYETGAYPNSTNMINHQGMGCGCSYSTNEYPMVEQNTLDLSGYVTKTVEIFPETNRVCIEIGETSGTFMLESIEFIRMDCE